MTLRLKFSVFYQKEEQNERRLSGNRAGLAESWRQLQ